MAIAIVGMACTFPGARDPEQFWRNIRDGVESLTFLTETDLAAAGVDPVEYQAPNYVPVAAAIDDVDLFDAPFFGMSPREASLMDPQHRLFLEHCWRAVEHAGYAPDRLPNPVGVFGGAGVNSYIRQVHDNVDVQALHGSGESLHDVGSVENDLDYLTTRVSYKLNLTGPSITLSTACSTSLVAIHMAVQSLRTFECDAALAGGIAVTPPVKAGYVYQEGSIASFDGHTRSFDASSTGTVLGAGVGVVMLKRLEDALADGDTIHAVIAGSAVNNDGSDKAGFTAPGVPGQSEVTAAAHAIAGIAADTVAYQEAHGTATRVGDPIEVRALTRAFRETTDAVGYCALGSVKANVGHMDAASGVAGLLKAAMAVRDGIIPPQINFERPNPGLNLEHSPFYITTEARNWPGTNGAPRRAGVSGFGFGGTNAHMVLEQPPAREESRADGEWQILPVSARDQAAVEEYLSALADHVSSAGGAPLADVATTLQLGRTRFTRRAAVVARDRDGAQAALRTRMTRPAMAAEDSPEIAFLFPGQGSQYPGMARDLYARQPLFRELFDQVAGLFEPELGLDLRTVLFDDRGDGADHPVNRTSLTQPALFAVEYCLARTVESHGIRPAAMIGHSLGEIVAATLAGVFTLPDAVRVVARRAALMDGAPPGAMLAIALPAQEVEPLLPEGVSIAAYNAPSLVVATGPNEAIDALAAELGSRGHSPRRLRISCASHSVLMEEPARQFTEFLRQIPLSAPDRRVLSNVTGDWLTTQEACDPAYWGRHLRGSVRFADGIEALLAAVSGPLLEVGPGGSLLSLARAAASVAGRPLIPAMRHPKEADDDLRVLLAAIARLWEAGAEPDWDGGQARVVRRVPLPTYPFQRRRHWIEASSKEELRISRQLLAREDDPDRWYYAPTWTRTAAAGQLPAADPSWQPPAQVLLIAGKAAHSCGLADGVAEQVRARGMRCVLASEASQYRRHPDDRTDLDITDTGDLRRLLADEQAVGGRAAVLLITGGDKAADPVSSSLTFLALGRALADEAWTGDLLAVTHGAFDVLGTESPSPDGWVIDGLARVLPREVPGLSCRVVDIDLADGQDLMARALAGEVGACEADAAIAYRRGRRWRRGITALTAAGTREAASRLPKDGGTYLITGGLGGIGLSLAEFLATRYRANLILTGASPFPARGDWETWTAGHGEQDAVSRKIARLRQIEAHGSQVLARSSDVTDPDAVARLLAQAQERFGRIDGIVHAAGLPGGGLIQTLSPGAYRDVLAPKVRGAQNLLAATRGKSLDFLMLVSSLNVVDGRFGVADYTAANSYLDGLAHQAHAQGRTEVMAVDWTGWRDLGMALNAGSTATGNEAVREAERQAIMTQAGMASFLSEEEGHQAFLRSLSLGIPQVHISTQSLQAVIENGRRLDVVTALAALAETDREADAYERPETGQAYEAPDGPQEQFICDAFQLLLGIARVGATDDFFAFGGNSLLALDVLARIKRRFGADVPVGAFLAEPTARSLASLTVAAEPAGSAA